MTTANLFEGQGTGLTQHASGNPDRAYDELSTSAKSFWATTMVEREKTFAVLRRERPITWQPPFEENLLPVEDDYGYWAITTHRHLIEITRRPEDFLSGPGIVGDNLPAERAHELGLVNVLAEPGSALEAAIALAEKIAANGPLAVAASRPST